MAKFARHISAKEFQMENYKLIASDLDGTLLNSKTDISDENMKAIDCLDSKGVFFVPCSGRTFSEIPAKLKNNKSIRYFIHSNGAVVLDSQTGKRILNCIPNSNVRKILDILYSFDTHIIFRLNGECFADKFFQSPEDWDYYNLCEAHRNVIAQYAVHLENFKEIAYSSDNVEVFAVYFHLHEQKKECMRMLEKIPGLNLVELDTESVEIVTETAGKGNALSALADMLGIDISQTISLGDSGNDISITQTSGLGLAMSNACQALKQVADGIICSNDEHAVKYVLEKYFS